MGRASTSDDSYSEQETVARREAALRRMFSTPHKPLRKKRAKKSRRKPRAYLFFHILRIANARAFSLLE
jgi:hypothetical protein